MSHDLKDNPGASWGDTKASVKPYYLNKRVVKDGGSFQHTGIVVAEFKTTKGADRLVLEFDAPVDGMLHVYRPDQVRVLEWYEEQTLFLKGLIAEQVNPGPGPFREIAPDSEGMFVGDGAI